MSEDPLTPESAASVSVQTEGPSTPSPGEPRPHRRRRRRRRRGRSGGGGQQPGGATERAPELTATGPEHPVEGVLYLPPKETAAGVLVSARNNYLPSPRDPLVPRDLVSREGLEPGAHVSALAAEGNRPVVRRIEKVEGLDPEAFRRRPTFQELVSIDPHDHLQLETTSDEMCGRVVDLLGWLSSASHRILSTKRCLRTSAKD